MTKTIKRPREGVSLMERRLGCLLPSWASPSQSDTTSPIYHVPTTRSTMVESVNTSRELVLASTHTERLITEDMGFEVIQAAVGPSHVTFTIHKNLLVTSSPGLAKTINGNPKLGCITFEEENPEIFKLYIEFLYSRRIPGVTTKMQQLAQAARVKDLCQLYAMADRLKLYNEFKNKIMDKIQDGFLLLDRVPEPAMVNSIFKNTPRNSMLRKFGVACLLHHLRSDKYVSDGGLETILTENNAVLEEFLIIVRESSLPEDPRVRQCGGAAGNCVECDGNPSRLDGIDGTDPCRFHQHKITKKGEDGVQVVTFDQSCHLWKRFAA